MIFLLLLVSFTISFHLDTRTIITCDNLITTCDDTFQNCCCDNLNSSCGCCAVFSETCSPITGCSPISQSPTTTISLSSTNSPSSSPSSSVNPTSSQTQSIGATHSTTNSPTPNPTISISTTPTFSITPSVLPCQEQFLAFSGNKKRQTNNSFQVNNFSFLKSNLNFNLQGGFYLSLNNSFLYSPLSFTGELYLNNATLFINDFKPYIIAINDISFEENYYLTIILSKEIYISLNFPLILIKTNKIINYNSGIIKIYSDNLDVTTKFDIAKTSSHVSIGFI